MCKIFPILVAAALAAGCTRPAPEPSAIPPVAVSTPAAPSVTPSFSGTPTVISPMVIPELQLWLRADMGTSGRTTVGGWASQTESRLAAVPSDPAKMPVYIADAINGQPALRFDGTQQMLEVPLDIGPKSMPELTVITVFRSKTADTNKLRKVYGHDDGGYDRAVGLDHRGDKNFALYDGSKVLGYFDLKADTSYILVDEYGTESFSGWVNGALMLDQVKVSYGEGLAKFYIGGTGVSFDEFWEGDIAEVIVYSRVISDEERKAIVENLSYRYKIATSDVVPSATPKASSSPH